MPLNNSAHSDEERLLNDAETDAPPDSVIPETQPPADTPPDQETEMVEAVLSGEEEIAPTETPSPPLAEAVSVVEEVEEATETEIAAPDDETPPLAEVEKADEADEIEIAAPDVPAAAEGQEAAPDDETPPLAEVEKADEADGIEIAAPDAPAAAEGQEAAPDDETSPEVEASQPAETGPPPRYRRGKIIEGIVTATSPTEVFIEIDGENIGIVSGREMERMDRDTLAELQVGRKILAYVLIPRDRSGRVVLSLNRALEERDWRRALEYKDKQDVYEGKISGYNRGGLIVRFGRVRGFVPASQVSKARLDSAVGNSPQERWGKMVGETITIKVMEVNRQRSRLILSERMAMKEGRNRRKAELLDALQVGDVRTGRVVNLADFGAFVDLGGADGLIHLTELSWRHVTHPREILKIGQEVEVEVINLDPSRRRIGLSLKTRNPDPWQAIVDNFQVNQLVQGSITKLTRFGAFVCLNDAPEIEGLIHISELADHRVAHPREVVTEGEELTLRIVKIDRAQRRMGLSLKQVDAEDYLELDLASYNETEEQIPIIDSPADDIAPADDVAPDDEAVSEDEVVQDDAPPDDEAVPDDAPPADEQAVAADDEQQEVATDDEQVDE